MISTHGCMWGGDDVRAESILLEGAKKILPAAKKEQKHNKLFLDIVYMYSKIFGMFQYSFQSCAEECPPAGRVLHKSS